MKSVSKTFLPEVLTNPISRNLILIFIATLLAAVVIVTASIMIYNQW
jgi:hypothetical protein